MNKIDQKVFKTVEYPDCQNCLYFIVSSFSDIFGNTYGCKFGYNELDKKYREALDNKWEVEEENKNPIMCPRYKSLTYMNSKDIIEFEKSYYAK